VTPADGGTRGMRRRLALAACLLLLAPCAAVSANVVSADRVPAGVQSGIDAERFGYLDWVPRDALPEARRLQLPTYCDGAYLEPAFPLALDSDPFDAPVEARGDRLEYLHANQAMLEGDVRLTQGNRSVTTPRAILHETDRRVELTDPVGLREPGLRLWGRSAEVELDTGAAEATDAVFVLHASQMRGRAALVERDEDGSLRIRRAGITRCEPGHRAWELTGRDIRIGEAATHATVRHAALRIYRVPLLYTPYMQFPITDDRMTGWLVPDVGYSSGDGLDFGLPYYLNLAPNYDATVTPRYISRRGPGGELELRHLSRRTRTTLGGALVYRDDRFDGELSREDFDRLQQPGTFEPADRWLINVDHDNRFGHFRSLIDYTAVSDGEFFRDLDTGFGGSTRRHLERRGEVLYQQGGWIARLWAQNFQLLDQSQPPYERLPAVDVTYSQNLPGRLAAAWQGSWARFHRSNERLSGIDRILGDRFHLEPRVLLPLEYVFGFLRFETGYRMTAYRLDDVPADADERPTRSVFFGSADGGLFFERELMTLGQPWLQTLEPRIYYLYQERADQSQLPLFDTSLLTFSFDQLFRSNRFSGIDRIGDANQVSLSVTTRFLRGDTGRERLRASIGQIYHLQDREVTLRGAPGEDESRATSPLAGHLGFSLWDGWSLRSSALWDLHATRFDEAGVAVQFQGDRHRRGDGERLLNLGYRLRQDRTLVVRQSEFSVYWPLASRLSALGSWTYDLEQERTIEAFGGLEYNDCCWQVRVIARSYQRNPTTAAADDFRVTRGVHVQVVFKGLAGLGGRMEPIMESGIRGYRAGDVHGRY
jgi:LPS-assembly protein